MNKVSKKMIVVKIVRNLFIGLIFLAALLITIFSIKGEVGANVINAIAISGGILISIYLVVSMIFPFLAYKNYKYSFDGERIIVQFGVIFKHNIVVPIIQLQDIHLFQGPIMQLCNVASVMVSTAGSNFYIQYLEIETAKEMVEVLEEFINNKHNGTEGDVNEEVL